MTRTGAEKSSSMIDKLNKKLDKELTNEASTLVQDETTTSSSTGGEGSGTIRVWRSPKFGNSFYSRTA